MAGRARLSAFTFKKVRFHLRAACFYAITT